MPAAPYWLVCLLSSRWLWLMPNPTALHFLRDQEPWSLPAELAKAWPLCEYTILQCWVTPAKDISSACNWFVHIYKHWSGNWSCDARALPWMQPEPVTLTGGRRSFCVVLGHLGVLAELSRSCSSASGLMFAVVLVSAWCVQYWKWFAPLLGYCISEATIPSCGSYMSVA